MKKPSAISVFLGCLWAHDDMNYNYGNLAARPTDKIASKQGTIKTRWTDQNFGADGRNFWTDQTTETLFSLLLGIDLAISFHL
jgi:hypothetical protein